MEDGPAPAEADREMQHLLGLFDGPAFMRRARGVKEALQWVLARAAATRDEWLMMVKLHLGTLFALAGDPRRLRPLLAGDDQVALLAQMHRDLAPVLRAPPEPTRSVRALRRCLRELVQSVERFNGRWRAHVEQIDVSAINEARTGYNRWYVLEKECAVRSPAIARQGFEPLPMCDAAELFAHLPLLPVPVLM